MALKTHELLQRFIKWCSTWSKNTSWNCSWWASNKRQELLTLRRHLDSPPVFGGDRVVHVFKFSVLCFLFCLSSSCVLCTLCCQFLWIVHSWLPLMFSLTFIRHEIFTGNIWYDPYFYLSDMIFIIFQYNKYKIKTELIKCLWCVWIKLHQVPSNSKDRKDKQK